MTQKQVAKFNEDIRLFLLRKGFQQVGLSPHSYRFDANNNTMFISLDDDVSTKLYGLFCRVVNPVNGWGSAINGKDNLFLYDTNIDLVKMHIEQGLNAIS